ncbi:hypothetical protein ACJX0J_012297, partial [Zea mays]
NLTCELTISPILHEEASAITLIRAAGPDIIENSLSQDEKVINGRTLNGGITSCFLCATSSKVVY